MEQVRYFVQNRWNGLIAEVKGVCRIPPVKGCIFYSPPSIEKGRLYLHLKFVGPQESSVFKRYGDGQGYYLSRAERKDCWRRISKAEAMLRGVNL